MDDRGNRVHGGSAVNRRVANTVLAGAVVLSGTQSEGIEEAGRLDRILLGGEDGQSRVRGVFILVGVSTALTGRRGWVEGHVVRLVHDVDCVGVVR